MTKAQYIDLIKMIGRGMLWQLPLVFIIVLLLNGIFADYHPLDRIGLWLEDSLRTSGRFYIYMLSFNIYDCVRRIKRREETKRKLAQYDGLYTDRQGD